MPPTFIVPPDDAYHFDEDAADDPIDFIENLLVHTDGVHAGKPFLLAAIQKTIIRDIYGWQDEHGLRRFSKVYWEGPIGCGKSPILAALGIYELVAGGEPGAALFSVASNFKQARIVFDCAKKMIMASDQLSARLVTLDKEIRYAPTGSVWRIISGKTKIAGASPSFCAADEIHEWGSYRDTFDSLVSRMAKRAQPILICATNSGTSKQSLWWSLREEAVAVLEGRSKDKSLYPIIWAAPKELPIGDPKTWKIANPLLGITISEEKIAEKYNEAVGSPSKEADFRRLMLSQPQQSSNRWLNIDTWKSCIGTIDPNIIKDLPLYVGVDLSESDDLICITYIWASESMFYVTFDIYIPSFRATEYITKDALPYDEWEQRGDITMVDTTIFDAPFKRRLADKVIAMSKTHKLKGVFYDRYRSDDFINHLESASPKILCVGIGQGWGVTLGCRELDARLKNKSITITDNHVAHFCAENVEVTPMDRLGNYWPLKPYANTVTGYAGRKAMKIDAISSLVSALTEARKCNYSKPKASAKVVLMDIL